mmetsp:Transcript_9761/g.24303  ORF Transcript_9761/g.24303 Transcript_9761/m.24303 type:complete len:219 (-) Transcript_9761:377-1033(-)
MICTSSPLDVAAFCGEVIMTHAVATTIANEALQCGGKPTSVMLSIRVSPLLCSFVHAMRHLIWSAFPPCALLPHTARGEALAGHLHCPVSTGHVREDVCFVLLALFALLACLQLLLALLALLTRLHLRERQNAVAVDVHLLEVGGGLRDSFLQAHPTVAIRVRLLEDLRAVHLRRHRLLATALVRVSGRLFNKLGVAAIRRNNHLDARFGGAGLLLER